MDQVFVVLLVAVVVLAAVLLAIVLAKRLRRRIVQGGAADDDMSSFHQELFRHALELKEVKVGGNDEGKSIKDSRRWWEYDNWQDMIKNATPEYNKDRTEFLENFDKLDWSQVVEKTRGLLDLETESMGVAVMDKDHRMRVTHLYTSKTRGNNPETGTGASVEKDIVEKAFNHPGLVLFHTHPKIYAPNEYYALPSVADLSSAIQESLKGAFIANAIVSEYGVYYYAPGVGIRQAIFEAYNKSKLEFYWVLFNYIYDVVSSMSSDRSWEHLNVNTFRSQLRLLGMEENMFQVKPFKNEGVIFTEKYVSARAYNMQMELLAHINDLRQRLGKSNTDFLKPFCEDIRKTKTKHK